LPPAAAGESGQDCDEDGFAYELVDEYGSPTDGEIPLDPPTWARAFLDRWETSPNSARLLEHNADALLETRRPDPQAEPLLDAVTEAPKWGVGED
jgi:hypothetical protein